MNIDLATPVSEVSRVGKTTASRLKKLGIETVYDLIFYYPFRWEDLSQVSKISELQPGQIVTVKAKLQIIKSRRSPVKKRLLTEGLVEDDSGSIKVIWFNQPYIAKILKPGDEIYLSGKVSFDKYSFHLVNPVYEKSKQEQAIHTARLVPIYSLTNNVTQKQLRFLINESLKVVDTIKDFLPQEIISRFDLVGLTLALRQIHFPENQAGLDRAIRRLKFDELFLFQLQVVMNKAELAKTKAIAIDFKADATKSFVAGLPFELTDDQKKSAWNIIGDLKKVTPMNRLLEGDVGSGKTVVATLAMLNVALNNKQSALLAPTEILAAQHYKNIFNLLKDSEISCVLLTRSLHLINNKLATKKEVLDEIKIGSTHIIIGTHAMIQEKITFDSLALAVIDEQHRFGVAQRKLLTEKSGDLSTNPHLLSMTATPIPRSLALTLYGDLDLSVITTMPKERKKIITKIIPENKRASVYVFIKEQIELGHQVFIICPLIDISDKLGVKAVTNEYEKLKKDIFPDLSIAMLHGKLKAEEKEQIMSDFLNKKSDILVSTSVVEVGVDVPNATVMLVEGAERFGLAQLHQFRGRVGRSIHQSYCFVITESNTLKTKNRLDALVSAKNGFELAEFDLQFRGPGEIYGVKQSGWLDFKIASLADHQIIEQAKIAAEEVIGQSQDLKQYPALREKAEQFIKSIHLE